MKKVFIVFCLFFSLIAGNVLAQTPSFAEGDKVLGLGLGIFGGDAVFRSSGYSSTPYLTGYFEKCVKDNLFDEKSSIGIGATVGFKQSKYEYNGWGWKYNYFLVGARGALHYSFVDKLDTYAGLMLGYRIATSKEIGSAIGNANNYGGFTSDFFIGGRYYFNDKFGVFLELGYSRFSNGTIGVSIKL